MVTHDRYTLIERDHEVTPKNPDLGERSASTRQLIFDNLTFSESSRKGPWAMVAHEVKGRKTASTRVEIRGAGE